MIKMETSPYYLHKKDVIKNAVNRDQYEDTSTKSTKTFE